MIALAPSSSPSANKETWRRERTLPRSFNIGHPESDELSSIVLTMCWLFRIHAAGIRRQGNDSGDVEDVGEVRVTGSVDDAARATQESIGS